MIAKFYNIYNFDDNHIITPNTLVLCNKNQDKIGCISIFKNFIPSFDMNSYNEISFSVDKYSDMEICNLWEDIVDFKLIYIPEYEEYYEISVSLNESNSTEKTITGRTLCESELSQLYLNNIEINTEIDIKREDYKLPTLIYKKDDPKNSLLHRILKDKAPHYTIDHVDISIAKKQRTFSIDGTTIYDFLVNTLSEELECLVTFDSTKRSISIYDLNPFCNVCGEKIDLSKDKVCPSDKCNSTDFNEGYGLNTSIFISKDNLSKSANLTIDKDSVKNTFRVIGGDDIITATVAGCNPSGTNYITYFSDDQKQNMSKQLIDKLKEYDKVYQDNQAPYQKIMEDAYNTIDKISYLTSEKMPDIPVMQETTAEKEVAKLTTSGIGDVAVEDINKASGITVNSAVLSMAKTMLSKGYSATVPSYTYDNVKHIWKGRFTVTRNIDKEDTATSKTDISININSDYINFVKQKIEKVLASSKENYSILNPDLTLEQLQKEVKRYCLNRLTSFESAYQSCIDILIQLGIGESTHTLYKTFYKSWFDKLLVIQGEIKILEAEIKSENEKLDKLEEERDKIQKKLVMKNFLTEELWREYCSHIREGTYSNDNYISDGLSNAEIFQKSKELLEVASDELYKASTFQHTITSTIVNLLTLDEFKELSNNFQLGSWIFIEIDEKVYKLRLTHIEPSFDNINDLSVEFSDVKRTRTGTNDVKSIIDKAQSMSTTYSYVSRQAKQGKEAQDVIDSMKNEGIDTKIYSLYDSESKNVIVDEHGILARLWDDVSESYSMCQVRIIGDRIVFTDDNWQTVKTALGKVTYNGESKYGLITDMVYAGDIIGCKIVGSEITGTKFNNGNGTFMLDENGKLTVSEINITGGQINIGNFNVNKEGVLKLTDLIATGEFTGKINASSGKIGYFDITPTSYYHGVNSFKDAKSMYFGQSGLSITDQFSVDSHGYTTITNGKFGNWNVTPAKISDGILESSGSNSKLELSKGVFKNTFTNKNIAYCFGVDESTQNVSLIFPTNNTVANIDSLEATFIGNKGVHSDKEISSLNPFVSIYDKTLFYNNASTLPIIEDFGHAKLTTPTKPDPDKSGSEMGAIVVGGETGKIEILLPESFASVINTSNYYVQITPYSEEPMWVSLKDTTKFEVSGSLNAEFDWRIIGVRKGHTKPKYSKITKLSQL